MALAIIHHTTMSPGKLDLLRDWLPVQPWYLASGRAPELTKAITGLRRHVPHATPMCHI